MSWVYPQDPHREGEKNQSQIVFQPPPAHHGTCITLATHNKQTNHVKTKHKHKHKHKHKREAQKARGVTPSVKQAYSMICVLSPESLRSKAWCHSWAWNLVMARREVGRDWPLNLHGPARRVCLAKFQTSESLSPTKEGVCLRTITMAVLQPLSTAYAQGPYTSTGAHPYSTHAPQLNTKPDWP
jgi:ribosomal protein S12